MNFVLMVLEPLTNFYDNLKRVWRNGLLDKNEKYLLTRYITADRFISGTNIRDKEVFAACEQKNWRQLNAWGLGLGAIEAAIISCRGHLTSMPPGPYQSHHY